MIVRPPVYRESAPHKWEVLPQASRNHLLVEGGENLPWDVWRESFYLKFPKEIQAAIAFVNTSVFGPLTKPRLPNPPILDALSCRDLGSNGTENRVKGLDSSNFGLELNFRPCSGPGRRSITKMEQSRQACDIA